MIGRFLARHRRLRLGAAACIVLGAGWACVEGVVRSDWFREQVRAAMVRELGRATGGAVTIRAVRRGASRLTFEALDLRIQDPAGAALPPLLTVPETSFRLAWRSLLGGVVHLDSLRVRDPIVHMAFSEDGASNIPSPQLDGSLPGVAVRRIEISGGKLLWNGQGYAVSFRGSGLDLRAALAPDAREHILEADLSDATLEIGGAAGPTIDAARLSAAIRNSEIEVRDFALRADGYAVDARGTLRDPSAPRFEGSYTATGELDALAEWLLGRPGDWQGAARAEGEVDWELLSGLPRFTGTAKLERASHGRLDADASFAAAFQGDGDGVEFTSVTGEVLGGEVALSADLRADGDGPAVTAAGTLSGVTLGALFSAAGLGEQPWTGELDAEFDVQGSPREQFDAGVQITVRPLAAASKLPVEGAASIRYASGSRTARIDQLRISTPNASAVARGSITAGGRGALELVASIGSFRAVERIFAFFRPGAALPPFAPDGKYSFEGSLRSGTGQVEDAVLDGEFALEDFLLGGQRWERFALLGAVSRDGVEVREGELVDGGGSVRLSGRLPLRIDGALQLEAAARRLDAAKVARASGFGLPIEGSLAMDLEVAGTLREPEARSAIDVRAPRFFGEPFDSLSAEVVYGSEGFELRNGALERGDSKLQATASGDPQDQSIEFAVESNRWPLDGFTWVQVLAPGLSGTAGFALKGSGRATARAGFTGPLELEGSWEVEELRRADLDLGRWRGELRSRLGSPSVDFEWQADAFGGGLDGSVTLLRDGSAGYEGSVAFRSFGAPELLGLFDMPTGGIEGEITGAADFAGEASDPGTFELSGTIDRVEARLRDSGLEDHSVANVFPVRWGVADGSLRFDSMHLNGPGTDFEIDGSVALGAEPDLDVGLSGTLNLALLRDLLPGLEARGGAGLRVRLRGNPREPELEGTIEIEDGTLRSPGFQTGLSDIRGAIAFQQGLGRIQGITAESGGGTLRVDGTVAYEDGELEYRLSTAVDDVRVEYPPSLSSVIDGQLTLAGAGARGILTGEVVVQRWSTRQGASFSDLIATVPPPETAEVEIPVLEEMQLNVHIGAIAQLPVETALVRDIETDVDVHLTGTLASPSILGTIGIAHGEIGVLGTRYRINRGDIRFVNPIRPEPVLNIELETRIRGVDIALVLSGPGSSLDLSYRSDPPLPFHELVNLVAVGKEPTVDPGIASQRRIAQQSLVQAGADNLLSQAISNPVSQRLQRFFGVSRLKVDPQIGGLEANPSARISTEQQIADDITLIYSYDLSSAQQQAIRIEWNPDRKWSFIVTRDQNGLVGSDVLYKVRLP